MDRQTFEEKGVETTLSSAGLFPCRISFSNSSDKFASFLGVDAIFSDSLDPLISTVVLPFKASSSVVAEMGLVCNNFAAGA